MRWGGGLLLALCWLGTWVALITGRAEWLVSFAQSTESVVSSVILVWPVAAGFGVMQAVHARRSGTLERVAAWPGSAAARYAWAMVWPTWVVGCAGGLAAWATAGVIARSLGSPLTLDAMPGLGIAMLGVMTSLLWGWVGGMIWPSYVAAVAAAIVVYLTTWLLPAHTGLDPLAFTGTTALMGTAAHLTLRAVVSFALWQILAAVAAVFALRGAAARERQRRVTDLTLCGCLAAAGCIAFLLSPGAGGAPAWRTHGPAAWECSAVGPASTACLPRDLRAFGDDYFTAMRRADPRFRILIAPPGPDILYAQSTAASDQATDVFIYVETDPGALEATLASYLVTAMTDLPGEPSGGDCFVALDAAQRLWESILAGGAATDDEVRLAAAAVTGC